MKFHSTAAAIVAFAMTLPLGAQAQQNVQSLREDSVTKYNVCVAAFGSGATDAGCACTAGFIGGVMTEREYDIIGEIGRIGLLVQSDAPEAEIESAWNAFYAKGYTDADIEAVLAKLALHSDRGDAICSPYESQNTS